MFLVAVKTMVEYSSGRYFNLAASWIIKPVMAEDWVKVIVCGLIILTSWLIKTMVGFIRAKESVSSSYFSIRYWSGASLKSE